MRAAAATIVLVGAGLLAGHGLAQSVPVPTLPTVTVPAPPVTVPLPTVPKLPPPAPPAPSPSPPQVPSAPVQTSPSAPTPPSAPAAPSTTTAAPSARTAVSAAAPAVGSTTAARQSTSQAAGSPGPSSGGSHAVGPNRSGAQQPERGRAKRRRLTTVAFVLPSSGRVLFVVQQISPVCKVTRRFAVDGHAGLNRIRFPRAGHSQLDPGTYRITAKTRAGRVVRRVAIVVAGDGTATRERLAAVRASNVCSAAARLASASTSTGGSNAGNLPSSNEQGIRSAAPALPSASGPAVGPSTHSGGVLATSVQRAAAAVQPVLIALLALAIALLGIASLPRLALPYSRANELLAQHRAEIAALGAAAFLAVVVAFLVG